MRDLTKPEQLLVLELLRKHLDVPAVATELERYGIAFEALSLAFQIEEESE